MYLELVRMTTCTCNSASAPLAIVALRWPYVLLATTVILAADAQRRAADPNAGVLRAAAAGRGLLYGVDMQSRVKYPTVGPCGNFSCREGNWGCLDKLAVINISQINDATCDCADGSDEPSTAACAQGSFTCLNIGHEASTISSRQVGDGVCDCCDGADEHVHPRSGCRNDCKMYGPGRLGAVKRP